MSAREVDETQVITFLSEYRALECYGCGQAFGFQHKATGRVFCLGGCHKDCSRQSKLFIPSQGLVEPLLARMQGEDHVDNRLAIEGSRVKTEPLVAAPVAKSTMTPLSASVAKSTMTPLSASVAKSTMTPLTTSVAKSTMTPAPPVPITKPTVTPAPPVPVAKPTVTSEPPKPVAKPTVTVPKPVASAPVSAPPSNVGPKRHLWTEMKYSKNLLSPNAPVRVLFPWHFNIFTVAAEADIEAMEKLTESLQSYLERAIPMKQPPVKDEIVLSEYEGELYRARVTKVGADYCDLTFIDYGDKKSCHFSEVYPITDEYFKLPVYGLIVELRLLVPRPEGGTFEVSKGLQDYIYQTVHILDINKKGPALVPGQADQFGARLWNDDRTTDVSEKLSAEIIASQARNN